MHAYNEGRDKSIVEYLVERKIENANDVSLKWEIQEWKISNVSILLSAWKVGRTIACCLCHWFVNS